MNEWTAFSMTEDQLDRIDRNILSALASNGRLSMSELATKVGLSKTPVQARVKRLEKDGYIRGYQAIIDRERMGEGHVAFVQVKLSETRSAALDAFNRSVRRAGDRAVPHDGVELRLPAEGPHPGYRRPIARVLGERISGPAPCRPDLGLRGDGDGEDR